MLPGIEFSKDAKGFSVPPPQEEHKIEESIAYVIEIDKITHNPYQPRKDFAPEHLADLSRSIKEHGLIQPITVRRLPDGNYELISGERRLRASKMAGLKKIPAYFRDVETDVEMLEMAIIENVQRENLNPIEIANGYRRLMEDCDYTQEQVSVRVGKDRSTVANFLRLLNLPESLQEALREKKMSMGHAKALLGLEDAEVIELAGREIIEKGLSVRAAEALARDIAAGKISLTAENNGAAEKPKVVKKQIVDDATLTTLADLENRLQKKIATKVKITPKTPESGAIAIEFYTVDDLDRIVELLLKIKE